MNFDYYSNNSMGNEESAGPENDDFSDYIFEEQRGFGRGRGYSMNPAKCFGQGPPGHFLRNPPQHFFNDHRPYGNLGMNHPRFFGQHGPTGQFGPRYIWGRGFGPSGPPMSQKLPRENNSINFLVRCGVPKQSLRPLPKALLHLLSPQYCGVCAQGFDNFQVARLHYLSKNHNKIQRKWLAQKAEVGTYHPREIPLKSRELYCELCDVHITSKAHAESHYAGRSHRAIVEGRRTLKNPFLLQKGMQDRVEQLIRREKKHMKVWEEPEASAEEMNADPKPIPPELFCDICKTSVTCTEQMTMHLNGKRHLSKEKQHILKMMKSSTPSKESNPVEPAGAIEDDEAQNSTSNNKGENFHEDVYDWGQGSGNWDDDPQ